ncbi:MAG TPA: carboxypeptidase-like regulatory domain-containing protein, partial [Pyrinomonadaceae bacterium]|nr:carboxypeptidase-like regulatory domain-containing protein [Pyrinomonadaceae bacterium]
MTSRSMHVFVTHLTLIMVLVLAQSWLITQVNAQTTRATILGTVTNEKGELVPNAKVTAKNVDTNISRETTTDDAGLYRLPELVPGNYEVRVDVQGFAPDVRSGIDLTVGREAVVDFA